MTSDIAKAAREAVELAASLEREVPEWCVGASRNADNPPYYYVLHYGALATAYLDAMDEIDRLDAEVIEARDGCESPGPRMSGQEAHRRARRRHEEDDAVSHRPGKRRYPRARREAHAEKGPHRRVNGPHKPPTPIPTTRASRRRARKAAEKETKEAMP